MRRGGDDPPRADGLERARPAGVALGQVHAVRSRRTSQSGVGADQQDKATAPGERLQTQGGGEGVGRSEGAVNHCGAARQDGRRGDGVWRPLRVGEEQQGRQGLSRGAAPP